MKRQNLIPHEASGVFVFLLLGLFAVFSTVTVLLGAGAYRSISERAGAHSAERLSSAYVRSMLRARDEAGAVRLAEENGLQTLVLESRYGAEVFFTRIYVYDGMLRELFTEANAEFEPENGEPVCAADGLEAEIRGGLLTLRIRTGETWQEISCALYGAEGEAA